MKNVAAVKMATAYGNERTGRLQSYISNAIQSAGQYILEGRCDDQFPTDQIQGGAGTSMHMNVNEVIATYATLLLEQKIEVHPIDHVNMGQSTNDVIPTAMKITVLQLLDELIETYRELHAGLNEKAAEFAGIIKVGRTHLQDAVPITLGQEFAAHATMAKRDLARIESLKKHLYSVNLGGTAVGTGLNASRTYIQESLSKLREITGYQLVSASNLIDATQYPDAFLEVSAILTVLAANQIKMMNDLRLMASGPRAGLGEITLEARQKGSSIMPGKVNPVMPELVNQVSFQVVGNHQTILMAIQAGQFELNVMLPVVAKNLFESITVLNNGIHQFNRYCLHTIKANPAVCKELFDGSYAAATALSPKIGYDKTTEVVKEVIATGKTLKQILLEQNIMTADEYEAMVSAPELTQLA